MSKEKFDVLDMRNYRIEKLPVRDKSGFEKTLMAIGVPLSVITFLVIMFLADIPYLHNFNPESLGKSAAANFNKIGLEQFIYTNKAMLAIFLAALILWMLRH